jgi:hypothetical protein
MGNKNGNGRRSQKKSNAARKANGFRSRRAVAGWHPAHLLKANPLQMVESWTHFYLSARLVAGGSSSTAVPDGQDNEGGASTTLYTTPGAAAIPCLPPLSLLASAAEALLQSDAMAIDPAPSSTGGSALLQPPPLAGSTPQKNPDQKPETLKP